MSDTTTRGAADSESYVARPERKLPTAPPRHETREDLDRLMGAARFGEQPEPEPVISQPVLTDEQIADNYRRVKVGAQNTLVTVRADGKREYRHDVVHHGDGIKDSLGTDRGKGTSDSLRMLAKEGDVRVEGLLDKRGSDGKFKKGA
jgi:hypothetical protein